MEEAQVGGNVEGGEAIGGVEGSEAGDNSVLLLLLLLLLFVKLFAFFDNFGTAAPMP